MAPEHSFSKLRIGPPTLPRRASSTFASLKTHHGDHAVSSPPILPTTALTNEDFVLAHPQSSEEELSYRLRNGEDLEDPTPEDVSETADSNTASDHSNLDDSLQSRETSISFAQQVTLENGDKRRLDEPLSKSAPRDVPVRQHGVASATNEQQQPHRGNEATNNDFSYEVKPTGLPLDRRKERARLINRRNGNGERHPLLYRQTPVLDAPLDSELAQVGSLTSESTVASPLSEEATSSLNETLLSPIETKTTSPIEVNPFFGPASTRSRSHNRSDRSSMASSRRRSGRSANSSMSPASAFLTSLNRREPTEEATEPDDEGQEIGNSSGWIIGRKIGYGGFSTVKEVSTIDSKTGKRLVRAVKIVRKNPKEVKDDVENDRVQAEFEHEVSIWRFLRHRYIVPLIAVYDTPFATFCITRLNVGGTLHDLIRSRRQQYREGERGLSAHLAKRYTYQLACAIRYLHEDVRIVHRDIKLENCLLDMSAPDSASQGGNILICDFGMSDFVHNESRDGPEPASNRNIGPSGTSSNLGPATLESRDTSLSFMGSLEYAAPELIDAPSTLYSPAADIWAFGVVVYALLTGSLPFSHPMKEKLVVMIEKMQWDSAPLYSAPAVRGGGVAGSSAVDLVKGCLTFGPGEGERWDIRKVLEARWLVNCEEMYGDGSIGEDEEWQ